MLVCLSFPFSPTLIGAVIETQGSVLGGGTTASVGNLRSQMVLGGGLGLVPFSSSGSQFRAYSGPLSAIQNQPVVSGDRFNWVAALGDSLEISYADIAFLSGIVEPDGETVDFQVQVSAGTLSKGGVTTGTVDLSSSESFTWELPASGTIGDLIMTVKGVDPIQLESTDSLLSVEDETTIVFSVKTSEAVTVDESNGSNLGDAVVSVESVSETYTVRNDSGGTSSASGLQRLNAETSSWTAEQRRSGLMLMQQAPAVAQGLLISSILTGGANAADFEVGNVTLPLSLLPGESTSFTVTFSPSDAGDRVASVSFTRPGKPQGYFGFEVGGAGNRAPAGVADEVVRTIGFEPVKIRLADLLLNDTDEDGDLIQFEGLVAATTTQGRAISVLNDQWLVYYPEVADEPTDDSFEYRLSDGRGAVATAVVSIREADFNDAIGAIEAAVSTDSGQTVTISVRGIPEADYQVQYTSQLNPPNTVWTDLAAPVTASALNGSFEIIDPDPAIGTRIYRIIEVLAAP